MRIRQTARRRARLFGMVLAPVLVVGAVGSATAVQGDKGPNPVGDLLGGILHSPNQQQQHNNPVGDLLGGLLPSPNQPNQPPHVPNQPPHIPNNPGPNYPGPNNPGPNYPGPNYGPNDPDNGPYDPDQPYVPKHGGGTGGGGGGDYYNPGPDDNGGYYGPGPGDNGGYYDPRDDYDFPPGTRADECLPGDLCLVQVFGDTDVFRVTAFGGHRPAILTARLNGGPAPRCGRFNEGDSDWVQFHFANAQAGRDWTKNVSMSATERYRTAAAARRAIRTDRVCFAAPYFFVPAEGFPLTRSGGSFNGVLPDCRDLKYVSVNGHSAGKRPCVVDQQIVRDKHGYFIRDIVRVPAGPEDPRCRHHQY